MTILSIAFALVAAVLLALGVFEFKTNVRQVGLLPFYLAAGCFGALTLSIWLSTSQDKSVAVLTATIAVTIGAVAIYMKFNPDAFEDGF